MAQEGQGAHGLESQGFRNLKAVHWNLSAPELYERAVARGEGQVADKGPLVVLTGQHTGRSASDKFIVRDAASEANVWWDNNLAMTPAAFEALHQAMLSYAQGRELFVKSNICDARNRGMSSDCHGGQRRPFRDRGVNGDKSLYPTRHQHLRVILQYPAVVPVNHRQEEVFTLP